MNKVIFFYGSRSVFEKIIPLNDCRNLTDLVMEIDTDNRSFILEIPDKPIAEDRASNVILLDEFDKANSTFHYYLYFKL
ncbi:MAG: hypothetical protein PHU66_09960 [Bacteroidaceae bacterium]|nr:hypothetical protein [Bacteroidaceae bacterium]